MQRLCEIRQRFHRNLSAAAQTYGKGVLFQWSPDCQTAFESLKQALIVSPVLAMPTDEDVYVLDTDASNHSIGAVVSQIQGGEERVIAYGSRTYNQAEVNYCTTRKELLAVVYFMKLFKQYLLGREFLVRTDHAALIWLQKTPDMMGQQARWQERLQEFSFNIQHRPGNKHGNADALSRRSCRRPGCCLPAKDDKEEEVMSSDMSRTDVLSVGVDEVTIRRTVAAATVDRQPLETTRTTEGSLETIQEEPWSPPDVRKTEHSLGQNIRPSSSTQEATELKRREWVASAPKRVQVTASRAATDVLATGSGVLPVWKTGTSGNAR